MGMFKNEYVIFALVAIAIFTVYMSAVAMFRKDPVRERLKRVLPADGESLGFGRNESGSAFARFCESMLATFGISLSQARRDLYLTLAQAGLMSSDAAAYYLFFRRFVQPLLLVLSAITFIYLLNLHDAGTMARLLYLLIGAMLGIGGLFGARLYVENRTQKRNNTLQKSFSDALDLLLVCVESGLPLDAALARVTRELKKTHPVITEELDRTRVELGLLNDRVQALQNLALRTNTSGFKALVSSLIQSEKFGTSIADTLRTLSDEYRISRMLYAENKAARIPALITVPLIFFILPSFMLIIMGPPVIRVNQQGGLFPQHVQGR